MATKKLSELSALAVLADADTFLANDASEPADADKPKYVTGTVLKTYASGALTTAMSLIDGLGFSPQFRLSLVSGNPISLTDSSSVGTVYYTPYGGNAIQLYNGAAWEVFALSELSLSLTATADKNYDIFIDYNAGTPQMVLGTAWTSDIVRADALAYQNGRLVKSGTPAYLYVGTIRADGTNTTIDKENLRYVYNFYNRICKMGKAASNESEVSVLLGIEEYITASVDGHLNNKDDSTVTAGEIGVNLHLGSISTPDAWLTTEDDVNKIEVPFFLEGTAKIYGRQRIYWEKDSGSTAGMGMSIVASTPLRVFLWM